MNGHYYDFERLPYMIHGGDYNPDQWSDYDKMINQDITLMKKVGMNCATVGIFSWARIQKREGEFDFTWLDELLDRFEENQLKMILATPSAAMPAWMAKKYPEVLRTPESRIQNQWGARVNYCPSSPIYREKCRKITEELARRYGRHDSVIMWHVNNEISGGCFCSKCEERFRQWLKEKYHSLEKLNCAWWTGFWSHTYYDWEEVGFPGYINGKLDQTCPGQMLDMKRFFSYIMADHYRQEYDIIRKYSKDKPITTNTWRLFGEMNFRDFEPYMDFAALDFYPQYNDQPGDDKLSSVYAFSLDYYRGMKAGKPFVIMEMAPGVPLIHATKIRRPGLQKLITAQTLAHGANCINYFQWRKGRGGAEQYHGAVIDHCGRTDTKTFQEIQEVSEFLKTVSPIRNCRKEAEVAVVYDVESDWAISFVQGTHPDKKLYRAECVAHYRSFYEMGINADVVDMESDFSKYKLVIAPMLYLINEKRAQKIQKFVSEGGTFVTTFYTGWAEESSLAHEGGFPGLLQEVTGLRIEDMDVLNNGEHVLAEWVEEVGQQRKKGVIQIRTVENDLLLKDVYEGHTFCDQIRLEGARSIAVYDGEFYRGNPCITVNSYGLGETYYMGVRTHDDFKKDFYEGLIHKLKISKSLEADIPEHVIAEERGGHIFVMNFSDEERKITLHRDYRECQTMQILKGEITLKSYEVLVLIKQ